MSSSRILSTVTGHKHTVLMMSHYLRSPCTDHCIVTGLSVGPHQVWCSLTGTPSLPPSVPQSLLTVSWTPVSEPEPKPEWGHSGRHPDHHKQPGLTLGWCNNGVNINTGWGCRWHFEKCVSFRLYKTHTLLRFIMNIYTKRLFCRNTV